MANSLDNNIKIKEDVATNYENRKLPMLDVQMWMEDKKIRYKFYEKPMVSKLVIMERSALPAKVKMQVLAQEIVRRRRNTWRGEKKEEVDIEMTKFMVRLKLSVYSRETRWEILKSGTR